MLKYLSIFTLLIIAACNKSTVDNNALSNITLLPPDKSTSSYYDKTTFATQLNSANVVDAWNYIRYNVTSNKPGEGVKVLVIDSGITPDHNALKDRISQIHTLGAGDVGNTNYTELTSAEAMAQARSSNASNLSTLTAASHHGTAVSSIITGNSASVSGVTQSGIAFGAQIGVLQIEQNRLDGATNLDGYKTLISNANTLSNIIAANGYNIVNMSLSGYSTNSYEIKAINNAVSNNNVLIAIATGNNDGGKTATSYQQPQDPASFAGTMNVSNASGMILAVTGSDTTTNNTNAAFNFCGDAKAYCMAAQFSGVIFADSKIISQYTSGSGTSFATPMVSGAAAVIAGAYPTLSMKDVGSFLLRGADPKYATWETVATNDRRQAGGSYVTSASLRANAKDGVVSDVYGYGTLNLLQSVTLIQATKVTASKTFAESTIQASPVIGNAIANVKHLATVTTHDDYGTYTLNIGNNMRNINSLGASDKVSASIRNNMMHNFAVANIGNAGYMAFSGIIPQDGTAMTNGKFMSFLNQNGIMDAGSSQFNNMTFGFTKDIAGVNFSFKERYNAQNYNLVYNLDTYNPFLDIAFNSFDARRFDIKKRFGNWLVGSATMFGSGANLQALNNITPEQSRNFATTFSLEHNKSSHSAGVNVGILRESATLLGTYSSGALSLGQNNTTMFVKTHASTKMANNISLFVSLAMGQTQTGQRIDSLFTDVSQIFSRSFLVGMRVHKFAKGTAELTYSQPLASFGGNATLLTQGGHIVISLVPTAIEQDFGLSFTKQGKNQSISFQCAYMLNRNNIAVPPSFGVFASIRKII